MARIDVTKEEIAYLKLWLGSTDVSDISLFSWWVTNAASAGIFLAVAAAIALVILTTVIVYIHKRVRRRIDELENL